MKERGVGTPWTAQEDGCLKQAVAVHGECDNWKQVALSVPGRTNKACRKRWLHSLSPSIKKTAWTPEEDKVLVRLYNTHGAKWSVIARKIPGRTDDACSKRYREALDPSLKKDEWTQDEDEHLTNIYSQLGGRWGEVGRELNRSGLACRNRWRMLERKKAAATRDVVEQQSGPHPVTDMVPVSSDVPLHWTVPMIDPNQYWDSHSADYSRMIHANSAEQPSPFLQTHFSPLSEPAQELHSSPSSPPPFQFTSSSLSSALSIPARSSSTNDILGSSSQTVSPTIPPPMIHSNADFQGLSSSDYPPQVTTIDDMSVDLERPFHDTDAHDEVDQSQVGAAGGAPSPVEPPSCDRLTLFASSIPPTELSSLSRLSPAPASGTARAGTIFSSPHHYQYRYALNVILPPSLSRTSSAGAVGTARAGTGSPHRLSTIPVVDSPSPSLSRLSPISGTARAGIQSPHPTADDSPLSSLSRLSPASASGTARAGTEFSLIQRNVSARSVDSSLPSLSRLSSTHVVGTARAGIEPPEPRSDLSEPQSPSSAAEAISPLSPLSRLSPAGAFGTTRAGTVSSPLTDLFSHSPSSSLSRLSSSSDVGTARAGIGSSSSSPISTGSYYRTPAEKAARPLALRKRYERDGTQPRLSSKLPAASDVLAYACGHPQCWSADSTASLNCFHTSQQLSDHWKVEHSGDAVAPNSFRCSLTGCGKGWKSINGLQYHLQISKAHFQRALANIPLPQSGSSLSSVDHGSIIAGNRIKKLYICPHDQCRNQYKQLSGLRYHLSHGHSQALPAQLDLVPPALAQKFVQKLQKHAHLPHAD